MVQVADDRGYSVAVHSIGDYCTDLVMNAFESTGQPTRHRLEHAMLLSDAQIDKLAALRTPVTMQPEFLLRFGHSYLRQLGPEKAFRLKRFKSLLTAGVPLSFSSDRPIVPGAPWDGIRTAVNRPAFADQAENVDLITAVRAYTVEAARVNRDTDYGELRPGQWADFQLYDESPLETSASTPSVLFGPDQEGSTAAGSLVGNARKP
jgi:hypothetical protein